ncbi:MAG: glycosyltransferase [Deltaproteobacteria bacterium]|jgi:hypothetical protein|nr:glycosyltransferase [Deltaproteobacteria bacterium]
MNIACLDLPYASALEQAGHKVLPLRVPEGGLVHLPGLLREHGFEPDLFIQHERLGARLICCGLEDMPCPTAFISIDAHLNMYWHKYYARLFDLVFTPHVSLYAALPQERRHPQVKRFGPAGYARPFRPHAERRHPLAFAGMITEHRPARKLMVDMLTKECGLYLPDAPLPHTAMLDLFADARLTPNEAIALEVNYRLFEACSCGALVISQDVGEDQNSHFEPGLEFETYAHSLELLEKIRFYSRNLQAAEKIGRAGWQRVQACHLPAHRIASLLEAAQAVRGRASGEDAGRFLWLTLLQMGRTGIFRRPAEWFMERSAEVKASGLIQAMRLLLMVESAHEGNILYSPSTAEVYKKQAAELAAAILYNKAHQSNLDCNLAGAMTSLALERLDWAGLFWLRQLNALGKSLPESVAASVTSLRAPYDHYLAWGKLLNALGRRAEVGFGFKTGTGQIPLCAFECLLLARETAAKGERTWLSELHEVARRVPAFSFWDMGFLAELSLWDQANWRKQAHYALSALNNFRVDTGLSELSEARQKALLAGEGREFYAELEDRSSSGYIISALRDFRGIPPQMRPKSPPAGLTHV